MRQAHIELAPLLDVLLILFLALTLKVERAAAERSEDAALMLDEALAQARADDVRLMAVSLAARELTDDVAESARRAADLEAALRVETEQRTHLEQVLEAVAVMSSLAPESQAAMRELLERTITVVELTISGDRVASYRRLPDGPPRPLDVALIREVPVDGQSREDYTLEYRGGALDRVMGDIDNALRPDGPEDRVFFFMRSDGSNRCVGLVGIEREIRRRDDLVVLPPEHRCGIW